MMKPYPRRVLLHGERAQVMIIFALVSVVLFAIIGLSIDAGISYLTSDQIERGASASALAGVAYLPGQYGSAQNAALVEAARNGFTNNPNNGAGNSCTGTNFPCVTTSEPQTNQLTVTIKVSVPSTFLKLLGFGAHIVSRSATAEYLPPIALGQPGNQQGSALGTDLGTSCSGVTTTYCTATTTGLGSANNFYFERTEGFGNPRSEGDAYTPSPVDSASSCPTTSCSTPSTLPDVHQVSPMDGTEQKYYNESDGVLKLNFTGGSNYLIAVPPGQTLDVQVYSPAFAPDSNDQPSTTPPIYTYHEDDTSFPNNSASAVQYAAMSYTVFSVPTLSSDMGDSVVSQEVFYPYNATCLYDKGKSCSNNVSYNWFPPGGSANQVPTPQTGQVPWDYHQWVSVLYGAPAGGSNDTNLFSNPQAPTGYLSNPSTATVDKYFRLEVDTLQWNGTPTCLDASCLAPANAPNTKTQPDGYSTAHKGYAVRVVNQGTTTACATCTISAMDDMTVYTPIYGATAPSFTIPLFQLDQSYAGRTINVDIFDIGDVSGGNAYVGIEQPDGTMATGSLRNLGTSVGQNGNGTVPKNWNGDTGTSCTTCFQTYSTVNGNAYNGQWVQVQIQVPSTYTDSTGYWSLEYLVGAGATAGDTFSVQVGSAGSPDHLIA